MNPATDWAPGVIVLLAALAVGLFVLLRSRRGAALPAPTRARKDELSLQKDALYGLLREHAALKGAVGEAEWAAERDRLELEAARVFVELERVGDGAATAAPAGPTFGQRNPRLVGALWGAGVMLFVGALGLALQDFTKPRAEGGSLTGGNGGIGGGADAAAAQEPALSPAQEARIATLRAEVQAAPDDADARNRLGHALLHAGKLMEAFNEAEAVAKLRPEDAEARTHQAIVLIAIGDTKTASSALDKVIEREPGFAEALAYRGALHFQMGEAEPAVALLERAVAADPNLIESVQPLIDAARAGNVPAAPSATGASDGPVASAPSPAPPAASAGPSPDDITGTIGIDPAVADRVKPGDTLFVSARPPGVDRGPPTWVLRIPVASIPMAFTIGPANAMLGGAAPPELVITARIDRDGNAMTRSPEDLEGKSPALPLGTKGTTITLAAAAP